MGDAVSHVEPAGYATESDKEWFRKILDDHYETILTCLVPQPLLDEFRKSAFLKDWEIIIIQQRRNTRDKNREILESVKADGRGGYKRFKECLERSGQSSLSNFLENVEKGMNADPETLRLGVEMERKARERKANAAAAAAAVKTLEQWHDTFPRNDVQRESHIDDSPAGDATERDEEWFRKILDEHYTTVLEYLEPKLLLDEFRKSAFLKGYKNRDIQELSITTDKNRKIVERVKSTGEEGYKMFKECLVRSGQSSLANFLENIEKGEVADPETLRLGVDKEINARERKGKRKYQLVYEKAVNAMEEILTKIKEKKLNFIKHEVISERFHIQGPNSRECCDTLKTVFEEDGASNRWKRIVEAVEEIKVLMRTKIRQADVESNNCVVITMPCSSSLEMRRLLKILRGEDFQEGVGKLTKAFGETFDGSIMVQAKIDIQKFGQVLDSFCDQHMIDDEDKISFCAQHPDIPSSFYCSTHDTFCCEECAHDAHRTCENVRQSTSDFTILKTLDISPDQRMDYRIRVDEQNICSTLRSCILSTGEILLTDNVNYRLKKLDINYKVIGHYKFTKPPFDICIVDKGTVLVSFGCSVTFVKVEKNIEPKQNIVLKNECFQIAWHNDLLYYSDKSSIYKCDANGKSQTVVYTMEDRNVTCKRFVISSDGNKICIATGQDGLIIVDITNDVQPIISVSRELLDCTDVGIVNDSLMLACDNKSQVVWLISSGDGKVLRKIVEESGGLHSPWSICYDNTDCTLTVGRLGKDFISVFQIQIKDC